MKKGKYLVLTDDVKTMGLAEDAQVIYDGNKIYSEFTEDKEIVVSIEHYAPLGVNSVGGTVEGHPEVNVFPDKYTKADYNAFDHFSLHYSITTNESIDGISYPVIDSNTGNITVYSNNTGNVLHIPVTVTAELYPGKVYDPKKVILTKSATFTITQTNV